MPVHPHGTGYPRLLYLHGLVLDAQNESPVELVEVLHPLSGGCEFVLTTQLVLLKRRRQDVGVLSYGRKSD